MFPHHNQFFIAGLICDCFNSTCPTTQDTGSLDSPGLGWLRDTRTGLLAEGNIFICQINKSQSIDCPFPPDHDQIWSWLMEDLPSIFWFSGSYFYCPCESKTHKKSKTMNNRKLWSTVKVELPPDDRLFEVKTTNHKKSHNVNPITRWSSCGKA